MSTLKGTTMHPRCRHIGACRDLLESWFNLFSTSQNTSQIQFRTLKIKNQIFWFPCCSTREALFVDVSITNVGLILTKPGWFLFSAFGNSGYGHNSISSITNFLKIFHIFGFPWCSTREDLSIDVLITNVGLILTKLRWFKLFINIQNSNFELFWKKNQIFGFPWCSTREDLSIDVSITNVGLISTKLRWFQLFVKSQNSNFELKKNQIFGFPWCSTREDLSIDISITNVGPILTKLRGFLFSGCGQTVRTDGFGILTWKHVDTQKISTQSSKLVVSRRSLYSSPEVGDA